MTSYNSRVAHTLPFMDAFRPNAIHAKQQGSLSEEFPHPTTYVGHPLHRGAGSFHPFNRNSYWLNKNA
jgi:hypothetical protein